MRVEPQIVEYLLLAAACIAMSFYVIVGKWSDRVGRKKPILIGATASLVLLFPAFWALGSLANPGLAAAAERSPVVVTGQQCTTDPFAELFGRTPSACGKILEPLTPRGVRHPIERQHPV